MRNNSQSGNKLSMENLKELKRLILQFILKNKTIIARTTMGTKGVIWGEGKEGRFTGIKNNVKLQLLN